MNHHLKYSLPFLAALFIPLTNISAQPQLTSIVVFSTDSSGDNVAPDLWDTQPGNNSNQGYFDVWIQSGGIFLNGPLDSQAQPNISLSSGVNSFTLNADPGSDHSQFGISLFFNGAATPSISAFGSMLTAQGPHSFAADSAASTPGLAIGSSVPGAGTLSFISGGELITLTDFFWATPSVYNQDLVGQYSTGANGLPDYVGGMTLSVTPVPEPGMPLLAIGLLAGVIMICRRMRTSENCF
ncbi:MAG TPA: hypothetical protein VMA35_11135 [Candidatus Sulfopaludibacter sp.]|nr:hypothetical protein [Candidatus Sulfopaludibacter sp.]